MMLDGDETLAVARQAARKAAAAVMEAAEAEQSDPDRLANPDMSVLRLGRRDPPAFPLGVLGRPWGDWARTTAEAAACPVDNVIAPLLSSTSVLIGHSRWAQAVPGWAEPPHLWCGVVGDSGTGKSPGADALLRDVLPELEQRMLGDFPDRLAQWRLAAEAHAAASERWKTEVRAAEKGHVAPPMPPAGDVPSEPQAPRLRQNDVTIEKVAALLAGSAPKGLLMVRDELSGWLFGMNAYNDGGRSFWIEAYGGRPYRVERQKNPEPIVVPRLAVGVTGGTQPEKLAALLPCRCPALRGRPKCRMHGGGSRGPTTARGLARCTAARTKHGRRNAMARALAAQRGQARAAIAELRRLLAVADADDPDRS